MAQWKLPFEDLTFNKKIGKGNFGEVYDGEYLGTRVAIKKLFFVDDDFMQKYIEREMATLSGLAHPNIVQLMGLCIETDDMYIITEFVSGGDLRSKLKEENVEIDWPTRLSIARDIALAMNYLHSKGIMHRDLKSHNLLVSEGWKIKVCDFGLARSTPQEGENNLMTIVGTNEWMAPEVAMGERYDKSADVFSYGMVLYEIITRDKPPQRQLRDMYAFNPDAHKAKIPPETPPALWDLLCDCATLNAEDRPSFREVTKRISKMIETLQGNGLTVSSASTASTASTTSKKENGNVEHNKSDKKKEDDHKKKTSESTKTSKKKSSKKSTKKKSSKKDGVDDGDKKKKKKTKKPKKTKTKDKKNGKTKEKRKSEKKKAK